ncbi:hypothetical protein UFOVP907_44 [uncultured Caudovirales phage]|uniref:Uncharacterized protein n=1 Tax=uncultured Caudovirales phage TaxID=2100421 RepID=A0A6J5PLF8_9CAUD|nr:hypothetical protein UFOVP907_44 [uncultured Caudovirales phage]
MFHIIYLDNNAVLRPANHGITDTEWHHKCRSVLIAEKTSYSAQRYAETLGFDLLSKEEWSELIGSLDDPGVTSNDHYINSRPKPDKWDNSREIY